MNTDYINKIIKNLNIEIKRSISDENGFFIYEKGKFRDGRFFCEEKTENIFVNTSWPTTPSIDFDSIPINHPKYLEMAAYIADRTEKRLYVVNGRNISVMENGIYTADKVIDLHYEDEIVTDSSAFYLSKFNDFQNVRSISRSISKEVQIIWEDKEPEIFVDTLQLKRFIRKIQCEEAANIAFDLLEKCNSSDDSIIKLPKEIVEKLQNDCGAYVLAKSLGVKI